ncbi:MAG: hypothetical protein R2787_04755 [Saprospiraceae bacterium]
MMKVALDSNKYSACRHHDLSNPIALLNEDTERIHRLSMEVEGIDKVPNEETVEGIPMQRRSGSDIYEIISEERETYQVNKLILTWGEISFIQF